MKKPLLYLDNCCFNRPFDDQESIVIRLETDAKLHVQELIKRGDIDLAWSFILDYENRDNPFEEVRERIFEWKKLSVVDCGSNKEIRQSAQEFMMLGLHQKDASHIACAIYVKADYFLTTDKKILNKAIIGVKVINPIDFIRGYLNAR